MMYIRHHWQLPFLLLCLLALTSTSTRAFVDDNALRDFALKVIKPWANQPSIIAAIKVQNQHHANLSLAQIGAMDQQWIAEVKAQNRPLIWSLLTTPTSDYLKQIRLNSKGLYTEIFVMDNKGLLVGLSDVTSDYWQGDEDKFLKSYGYGSGAIYIAPMQNDESTGVRQVQISLTLSDGDTAIGAITVGVDLHHLNR